MKVIVAVFAAVVIETGLVLPKEHVGAYAALTGGEMVQVSETLPVYPFAGVTVIVAVDEPPGLTEAGFASPAERE